MDLIKSRSEVKVLLDQISSHKTEEKQSGANSEEKFPNLLLSSLDKLFEDKQQQLWLVRIILYFGESYEIKTKAAAVNPMHFNFC